MIKFFRKIRQQLLTENKFTKYLLYAIGEIVLVVIGILLALQINNNNQVKQQQIEVQEILAQIQEELVTNIHSADEILLEYCKKDSLLYRVLHDDVSRIDYQVTLRPVNNISDVLNLKYLVSDYSEFVIIDKAFNSLMEISGKFPVKYKPLLKPLKKLFESDKKRVYDFNDRIRENAFDNTNYWKYNADWFSNYNSKIQIDNKAIDFFLSDPMYKNQTSSYLEVFAAHLKFIVAFRNNAKKMHNEIATALGNNGIIKGKNSPIHIEVNDFKYWLGKYSYTELNSLGKDRGEFEIFFKENSLFERSGDSTEVEIIPLSGNLYCTMPNGVFRRILFNENGQFKKGNWHWWNFKGEIFKKE